MASIFSRPQCVKNEQSYGSSKFRLIFKIDYVSNDDVNTNICQLGHIFLVHTCADFDNDIFIRYGVMMKIALNIFTRGYRRLNLSSCCDVINGVINMTYTFYWIICIWSFHIWCQNEVILKVSKFPKLTKIWSPNGRFVRSVTGSWI